MTISRDRFPVRSCKIDAVNDEQLERRRAYNRAYYSTPEWKARQREYQRSYRDRNREKMRAASNEYHREHREQINARRRSRNSYTSPGTTAIKEYGLRSNHKMTVEEWEETWERQAGICYLCGTSMTRPLPGRGTARGTDAVIEHDHRCCPSGRSCAKCRRGLAHRLCNAIVGQAGDDPELLRKLADNLGKALRG